MEVIALLTTLKEMGFDVGDIMKTVILYFVLRKDLGRVFDKKLTDFKATIEAGLGSLTKAIRDLETSHKEEIKEIKTHVGFKK